MTLLKTEETSLGKPNKGHTRIIVSMDFESNSEGEFSSNPVLSSSASDSHSMSHCFASFRSIIISRNITSIDNIPPNTQNTASYPNVWNTAPPMTGAETIASETTLPTVPMATPSCSVGKVSANTAMPTVHTTAEEPPCSILASNKTQYTRVTATRNVESSNANNPPR